MSLIALQDIINIPVTDEDVEVPREGTTCRKHIELEPDLPKPWLGLSLINQVIGSRNGAGGQLLPVHLACDILGGV